MKIVSMTLLFLAVLAASCRDTSTRSGTAEEKEETVRDHSVDDDAPVYETDNLVILRLSPHVYQHISFLDTDDYGRVACNGMVVISGEEAVVFDTPADDESSGELIEYVTGALRCRIKAVIPTHFHEDCVGGLEKFSEFDIPAYASRKTIALLESRGRQFSKPPEPFEGDLSLTIGGEEVVTAYFGEGHTGDNVIGFVPADSVIFGGCLIKEVNAGRGNLADADTLQWPETVAKLKARYPRTRVVIPGHGRAGGIELLDYTIELFRREVRR